MKRFTAPLAGASVLVIASLLAACGGGGGGGSTNPPTGGGGNPSSSPSSNPSANPSASPQSASGTIATAANGKVAFTCGCTLQAGEENADGSGNFTITVPATGLPNGTYTPPGHNLMIIGYSPATHAQEYTMEFFGSVPAHDLNLQGNANANVADVYSTATALYVYYETIQYYHANPSNNPNDNTYDVWNFNTIAAFDQYLAANSGGNSVEQKLIADIGSAQTAGTSLYPDVPSWDTFSGDGTNAQIVSDIQAVKASNDSHLPVPCGTSCTGTPTP